MKYPCGIIQDLLPLYHDGVCSQESRQIIEAHLEECSDCKQSYLSLGESDALFPVSQEKESELKKSGFFPRGQAKTFEKAIHCGCGGVVALCGGHHGVCWCDETYPAGNQL